MARVLVRPYPVGRLEEARHAIAAAAAGDLRPLHALYLAATDALAAIDEDEVEDHRSEHRAAAREDRAAARAAVEVADVWEGIVSVGSVLRDMRRFRAFAWTAAAARYGIGRADAASFARYAAGADLPDTSPEDSALYAALPALVGLGPELPDELDAPCPVPGEAVGAILGLPEADWTGVDPLDGIALTADAARAHFSAASPEWREVLSRCVEGGCLVRPAD